MFAQSLRVLIRSKNYRSFSAILSTLNQHNLNAQPIHSAKLLLSNAAFSSCGCLNSIAITDEKKPPRKKTPEVAKITLIDTHDKMSVTTLEQAEKLATSRRLKLVRIEDMDFRSKRVVYKLMSDAQFLDEERKEKKMHQEEKKEKAEKFTKGDKMIILSSKISEGDLQIKLSKMLRWIQKRYEIRVIISGPEGSLKEQVCF